MNKAKILNFIIVIILLQCISTIAEEITEDKKLKIHFITKPAIGYNLPLTSFKGGHITDDLIEYGKNTYYLQAFTCAYFFGDIGAEFHLTLFHSFNVKSKFDKFSEKARNKFPGYDFLDLSSGLQYGGSGQWGARTQTICIGPVYKFEFGRQLILLHALFGGSIIDANWGYAEMKSKGTNELIQVDWRIPNASGDSFLFNPAVTYGYRLSNRIFFDFDINFWLYKIDITYNETTTNWVTNKIENEKYKYNSIIFEVSLGLGLTVICF